MERREFLKGVGFGLAAAAFSLPAVGRVVAGDSPMRAGGGGEATAASSVPYVGHDGVTRSVPSISTIGNRFTFGFKGVKDGGIVRGRMQLVDHDLGLTVHSDIAALGPHPVHNHPVGRTGPTAMRAASSTGGVIVNGVRQPGWRFLNSPFFDGGEGIDGTGDTVCFELFSGPTPPPLRQWSALLSSGNLQVSL